MADTISIENLKQLFDTTKDPALGTFIQMMETAGQKIANLGDIASRVSPGITAELQKIANGAVEAAKGFGMYNDAAVQMQAVAGDLWNRLSEGMNDYINQNYEAGKGIDYLATRTVLMMEPILGVIPQGITGMGEFGKASFDAGQSISDSFKSVEPLLKRVFSVSPAIAETLGQMTDLSSKGYSYQKALIDLAGAQGNLSGLIDESTGGFRDLNLAMDDMIELSYSSAIATGQSIESIMNLTGVLKSIPDAMSEPIEVDNQWISQLTLTSQVATAFGRSQNEVGRQLTEIYTNMGLKGQESFELIAKLYQAAGDSKLRFEGFNKSVMDIASSFKVLGDNTDAATNVVKVFDTAFKESKISPAAMQEVIAGMAEGVRGMERGTQAFVSAQTGGPGGLAGAFKIELALQEGRLDEVLQKTMTAMQEQFGGQVLTLKDAAENPALAGEFYKQVQYLTQVAGVARTDREAYRILEAMKTGVMDILQPGTEAGDRGDALIEAQSRGMQEQERTTSVMTRLQQELERLRTTQYQLFSEGNTYTSHLLSIDEQMRDFLGSTGSRGLFDIAGTEKAAEAIARTDKEDRIQAIADFAKSGIGKLFSPVFEIGKEKAGGLNLAEEVTNVKATEEERLMRTPVGLPPPERLPAPIPAVPPPETTKTPTPISVLLQPSEEINRLARTPVAIPPPLEPTRLPGIPPGTAAGIQGPLAAPLRPPPGPGILPERREKAINPMETFIETGEFSMVPIEVKHSPIEIKIDFGNEFQTRVAQISNEVYNNRSAAEARQGGTGRS